MGGLVGDTIAARKKCLAYLVAEHLNSKGHSAQVHENRTNSKGHTDLVVVESSIGLIHLTASSNLDPNEKIRISDYQSDKQDFLADKTYVAYGWNTKDNRTIILFVLTDDLLGIENMCKSDIQKISKRDLNKVFAGDLPQEATHPFQSTPI